MAEAKKSDKSAKKSQKKPSNVSQKQPAGKEKLKENLAAVVERQPSSLAKSGKRSARAVKESEEKVAKEDRKTATAKPNTNSQKPIANPKPARSRAERAGKKYREAFTQIDQTKVYNLAEAVDLATRTAIAKFDSTIEMHINLAVDPKQADQNVRDTVAMPHGTGKTVKIAVFAEGAEAEKAKKAGADIAGRDSILAALDKEQIDFDILVSTPSLMGKLGEYARLLGPRGLMPNPKSGTVTADVAKAVSEAKAGRVEYRVDQAGIIHVGIGKASFGPQKLLENAQAITTSVRSAKPASLKGTYIKSAYITSTMGPGIRAEL